jgi:hypothetical protein
VGEKGRLVFHYGAGEDSVNGNDTYYPTEEQHPKRQLLDRFSVLVALPQSEFKAELVSGARLHQGILLDTGLQAPSGGLLDIAHSVSVSA